LLTLIDSARARGAGGAGAALADDPGLAWLSSAAAGADGVDLTLGGQRGYIGDTAWQILGGAPMTAWLSLTGAFAYYDAGAATDALGRTYSAQQDVLGLLGATVRIAPWLTAGASGKAMRSELGGQFVANVAGADAAVRGSYGPVAASLGVQNAGARARYQIASSSDAAATRGGVAVELPGDEEGPLPQLMRVVVDAVLPVSNDATEWHAGAEAVWRDHATLRAGLMRTGQPSRWAETLGFGIGSGRFRLDYATVLGSAAGSPQTVSLTVRLARPPASGGDVAPLHSVEVEGDCREEDAGSRPPPP